MLGKKKNSIFILLILFFVFKGYLKSQQVERKMMEQKIIYFHGYIKNLKVMILMQVNIDFFVNLMICQMVRRKRKFIQIVYEGFF